MLSSMFDEFNKSSLFDESWKVNYLKEIKGLNSLQVKAESHLEPKRASMMELFVNLDNGLLLLQWKLHHRCLTWLYTDFRQ